ncbi:MAG TPA: class I SAM-dependent methyltransferase [Actinomycetes bacterium]|nr:class I SAM-dependent methyltransferase [Actinomycetes bacterium]
MGWEASGEAWGSRAADWAYLFEPYSRPANQTVFDRCGVGPETSLLDVGCGSGFAVRLATDTGAAVAGLDASASLLDIARARTPEADLRLGDMNALPWDDASFDVVTSFNSIWADCEPAAAEAARVLRTGGMFGMTFWGSPKRVGLLPYFVTIAMNSPQSHVEATLGQGNTGRPGVAEALVESAGLRVVERGAVQVTAEFPDLDTFLRAAVAAGPSFPAIEQVGEPKFREALGLAYADAVVPGIGMRIVSELGWLSAAK